jgi:hypothetical protein
MVALILRGRRQARLARPPWALSAGTRSGLVRGRPGPGPAAGGPGRRDRVQDGGGLRAAAALAGRDDDGRGLLPLLGRQVELDRQPARARHFLNRPWPCACFASLAPAVAGNAVAPQPSRLPIDFDHFFILLSIPTIFPPELSESGGQN